MEIILILSLFYQAFSMSCASAYITVVSLAFCSDTTDWVVGNIYPNGAYAALSRNDPKRYLDQYGQKIWETPYPYDTTRDITCYISKRFYVPGTITSPGTLNVFADDRFSTKLNDIDIGCSSTTNNETKTCSIPINSFIGGFNLINFTVTNIAANFDSSGQNNAYLRYCLTILTAVKTGESY